VVEKNLLTEFVAICLLLVSLLLILSLDDAVNYQDCAVSVTDEIEVRSIDGKITIVESGSPRKGTLPCAYSSTTSSARTGQRLNPSLRDENLSPYHLIICHRDSERSQIFLVTLLFLAVNSGKAGSKTSFRVTSILFNIQNSHLSFHSTPYNLLQ
jgi:hypothetical protein